MQLKEDTKQIKKDEFTAVRFINSNLSQPLEYIQLHLKGTRKESSKSNETKNIIYNNSECVAVLGKDIIANLVSRDWKIRIMAINSLSGIIVSIFEKRYILIHQAIFQFMNKSFYLQSLSYIGPTS